MSSMTAPSLSLISRSQRDAICGSWVAVKAAELPVRADLGVVDAAEHDLTPDVLAALRLPAAPAATPDTRSSAEFGRG